MRASEGEKKLPNKAVAAGGTTALAGALTTLLLSALGHPVSPDLQAAITTLVSAVLSAAVTYLTPHNGTTTP